MCKVSKLSVIASITKSFNYQSVSCTLSAECDLGPDEKPSELYKVLYERLTDRCIANVDAALIKLKAKIESQA